MKRQKYETSERKSDLEPVFRIRIRIGSANTAWNTLKVPVEILFS
jgi:hypothetical protein